MDFCFRAVPFFCVFPPLTLEIHSGLGENIKFSEGPPISYPNRNPFGSVTLPRSCSVFHHCIFPNLKIQVFIYLIAYVLPTPLLCELFEARYSILFTTISPAPKLCLRTLHIDWLNKLRQTRNCFIHLSIPPPRALNISCYKLGSQGVFANVLKSSLEVIHNFWSCLLLFKLFNQAVCESKFL